MKTKFRPVNTILGSQPRLGPIPADQIIPWFCITGASYFIGRGAQPRLAFDWLHCSLGHVHLVDSNWRSELEIYGQVCTDSHLESWLCPLFEIY